MIPPHTCRPSKLYAGQTIHNIMCSYSLCTFPFSSLSWILIPFASECIKVWNVQLEQNVTPLRAYSYFPLLFFFSLTLALNWSQTKEKQQRTLQRRTMPWVFTLMLRKPLGSRIMSQNPSQSFVRTTCRPTKAKKCQCNGLSFSLLYSITLEY